jgi:hypothetical protein
MAVTCQQDNVFLAVDNALLVMVPIISIVYLVLLVITCQAIFVRIVLQTA